MQTAFPHLGGYSGASGASSALHRRASGSFPEGGLRMNSILCSVMILCLCLGTGGTAAQTTLSRWHSYQIEKGQRIISSHLKRHSDGTFTSDYTNYLDRMKARHFVEWLARAKEQEFCKDSVQIPAAV